MRQFVTSSIKDINIGDVIHWRDGLGQSSSAKVVGVKRGYEMTKAIKLVSSWTPVQHMLNIHRVLKVDGSK